MPQLLQQRAGVPLAAASDVSQSRERLRQRRLRRLALVLLPIALWLCVRDLFDGARAFGLPHLPSAITPYLPGFALVVVLCLVLVVPLLGAGRSPHVVFRPSELDVRFDDVRGSDAVMEEVSRTLQLFLAHRQFADQMGGTPRRAILFEGPPGTGKTYMAKAMAGEAGVPFLFVSASAFQSMFYGQTGRKIRAFFRALRKYARDEGGAIGFIEEIDAIGGARGGDGLRGEGISGAVNELLIQLQSFDQPTAIDRFWAGLVDQYNRLVPEHRQKKKSAGRQANVLIIGATNRANDLDAALLRPGRFDRRVYFGIPSRAGRRDIIDYYLGRKSHDPALDEESARDALASITMGYSPVMIEHLLDEALVAALRRGADSLSWSDVQQAKMIEEIGLAQAVEYTEAERRLIATHESGHATVAWLVGRGRKLEVLSIIKRRDALGLLQHSETEERFTKTRSELHALIEIALGGMVAEELLLGETSSGVASDLQAATTMACQMIGDLGMGATLISRAAIETPGAGNIVAKVLSDEDSRHAVDELLNSARDEVREMLRQNVHVVEALRDALVQHEELIGNGIIEVIVAASERATTI